MPDWLATFCVESTVSTPLIVIAVVMYLPNLYFNSNSKIFKKNQTETEQDKSKGIEFTQNGVMINYAIGIVSVIGIYLTYQGC
jgi:hypothetical protein